MKNIVDKILLEVLDRNNQEIKNTLINNKWKIGSYLDSGSKGSVYNIEGQPDKVIKIFDEKLQDNIDKAKYMIEFNEVSVKVFDYSDYFIVTEKLNIKKIEKEYNLITKYLDIPWYDLQDDYFNNHMRKLKTLINIPNIKNIILKWYNFFMDLYEMSDISAFDLDIHDGNVGYDKNNNIKLFDI